jgi:glycosyltransferase involved in cell wall biosynthesis
LADRIRILYVIDALEFGGGERGFSQLSTGLNKERFKTYLAAHPDSKLEKMVIRENIPFLPIDMDRKVNFKAIAHLLRIINQHRIHIVHSMGARADFFARMAVRKLPQISLVCTVAMPVEGFDIGFIRKIIYKIADHFSSRYVTHFIAVSKAIKEQLVRRRNIHSGRITVVYNGVELDQYNQNMNASAKIRHSLGITDDYPIIGTIGRLVYQKGYSHFLQAAKQVYEGKKYVRFVIVGHGPEEDNLKSMAKSLGISHVCTFAGLRRDIPELLSAFDVFVLSSVLEGLPRIVIEAMAMGRPIVATDIDGVREELEDGITGLLVPPESSDSLAKSIIDLLIDKDKSFQMGINARRAAEEKFGVDIMLKKVEKVYEELLPLDR